MYLLYCLQALIKFKILKGWLVYSDASKGYWCLPCALYYNGTNAGPLKKGTSLKGFVYEPVKEFTNLTGTRGKFNTHSENQYHKNAVNGCALLVKSFQLDKTTLPGIVAEKAEKNISVCKHSITAIVELCILMCRQALSFRGKEESKLLVLQNDNEEANIGNFRYI